MKAIVAASVAVLALAACQPTAKAPPAEPASVEAPVSLLSADEQGLTTPEAFLEAIYQHYRDSDQDMQFTTQTKRASDYYDPEMVALMAEDSQLAGDEIGAIDADPICDCQDYGNITATVTIKDQTATTAHASVLVDDQMDKQHYKSIMTYDLVKVDGKWRIHDIGTASQPSLRQVFIRSNKELAAYAASAQASS